MNFGAMKVVMSNQLLCVPLQRHFVVFAVNKAHQKLSSDFFFFKSVKRPYDPPKYCCVCLQQSNNIVYLSPSRLCFFF